LCEVRYRRIISTCCWQRRRYCHRQNLRSTSKGVRDGICRQSSRSCKNSTGASIGGPADTSVRRWAQWRRERLKHISRTSGGTKTTSRSRSLRPPSLKPAFSRERIRRLQPQCDFQSPKDSTGFQPVVINSAANDVCPDLVSSFDHGVTGNFGTTHHRQGLGIT